MTENDQIVQALSQACKFPAQTTHRLSAECTFRLGGPARFFVSPEDAAGLQQCRQISRQFSLPIFILGGGSNVLFADEGFAGVVISTRRLNFCRAESGQIIRAGAGTQVAQLTALSAEQAWSGLEWAAGLPGTVGGGVVMNAKCYGGVFADVVDSVTALDESGSIRTFRPADCAFGYKTSIFQNQPYIITEVALRLAPGHPENIRRSMDKNLADRTAKGQFEYPSAGCVFKNAYEINTPAGKLIEDCGLKNAAQGGARVFEKHANFIINPGQATAQDVLGLIALIRKKVLKKFNYPLQEEIRVVPFRPLP